MKEKTDDSPLFNSTRINKVIAKKINNLGPRKTKKDPGMTSNSEIECEDDRLVDSTKNDSDMGMESNLQIEREDDRLVDPPN